MWPPAKRYNSRVCFAYDTRSYADVVQSKPSASLQLYKDLFDALQEVDCIEFYDNKCRRWFSIEQTRRVLLRFYRDAAKARWQYGTRGPTTREKTNLAVWKHLFYKWRDRVNHFHTNFFKLRTMRCQCIGAIRCELENIDEDQRLLAKAVRESRGPHGADMCAFMMLYRHVGNDLALFVFSFL